MKRRFGILVLLVALFSMAGGVEFSLRSVAWTQMFLDFSKTDSIEQALTKTFDGEHKCTMCLKLDDLRKDQDRQTPTTSEPTKIDVKGVAGTLPALACRFSSGTPAYAAWKGTWSDRPHAPTLRPPRVAWCAVS